VNDNVLTFCLIQLLGLRLGLKPCGLGHGLGLSGLNYISACHCS